MSQRPACGLLHSHRLRTQGIYLVQQMGLGALCGPELCDRLDKPHVGAALFVQCFQTKHPCLADRSADVAGTFRPQTAALLKSLVVKVHFTWHREYIG